MKVHAISFFAALLTLCGCATHYQYMVNGTISQRNGDSLYLKVFDDSGLRTINRAQMMHGRFTFSGAIDSLTFATLYLDDHYLVPFVLEDGDITLNIDENICTAQGTPLNDSLSTFVRRYVRIEKDFNELPEMENDFKQNGMSPSEARREMMKQMLELEQKRDSLISAFIQRNYENLLGPGVFRIMTNDMPQPMLTPLIHRITNDAPDVFLADPYVRDFMRRATLNMP